MAIVTTDNQHYTDIAAAIRSKNGTETLYKPSEMAAAIQAISGGGEPEPPDDGKTRLYITVPANAMPDRPPPRNQVPLYIQQTVANGVTIDWGDGTAPETLPGTGNVNTTHTYEQAGDYVISLEPAEGCTMGLGSGSSLYCIMGSISNKGRVYCSMLQKVYIGKNVNKLSDYSFKYCQYLKLIKFYSQISEIGNYSFQYCGSLSSISADLNNILDSSFDSCAGLSSIVLKANNIGSAAFAECSGAKEYHFLDLTPPVLKDIFVFRSIPSDCIIYVPKGSTEAYKTATNWTIVADHIQEEPDPIVPEILKAA